MQKQTLILTLAGSVPSKLGTQLRKYLYPYIFGRFNKASNIYANVEFQGTDRIEIQENTVIRPYARIRRIGRNSTITLGNDVLIDSGVDIRTYAHGSITLGSHCSIGPYTCISGGQVIIGKNCLIASHCSIYANNHIFTDPNRNIREQGSTEKGITIGDDCWIGSGARILDGVTIGMGSVIGAGAVVTASVPPYSVAVGVPARIVKKRT